MGKHSGLVVLKHIRVLWFGSLYDLRSRYAGSLLGSAWFVLSPLLTLMIYGIVYLYILKISVPGLGSLQYVLYIFAGLAPFLSSAESLSAGTSAVLANKALASRVDFPIDLAPVKTVLTSQGAMAVGMTVVFIVGAFSNTLTWVSILVVPLWFFTVIGMIGIVWIFSLLNVVIRDLQTAVGTLIVLAMIASPIGYTEEMVPEGLKSFFFLNPVSYYVRAFQHVLVLGRPPVTVDCIVIFVLSVGSFAMGGWFFGRTKQLFLDYV